MSVNSDPYIWLEDINNPKVIEWIRFKNMKTKEFLSDYPDRLRPRVMKYYEIPTVRIARLTRKGIYLLVNEKLEYRVYRLNNDGSKDLIISSRDLGDNIIIKWIYLNEDGDRLIVSYSKGSDIGYYRLIDPFSNEVLDELYGSLNDFVWIDKDRYYYVRFYRNEKTPDNMDPPAERIFLRSNGYEEMITSITPPTNYLIALSKSIDSSKALLTISHGWSRSWVYAGDLDKPDYWVKIFGDDKHIFYPVNYVNGRYIILAYDGNGLGRIVEIKDNNIRELISEDENFPLKAVETTFDKILALYLVHGSSCLKIFNMDGNLLEVHRFDPPGSVGLIQCIDDTCIFKYETSFIPYRLYLYRDNELRVIDRIEINSEIFGIEEFWVESYDKTPIHVFRIYNRKCDNKKTIIYGYGGFGVSISPVYASYLLTFIEDCGSICIANLRGGGEYGEKWHRAGKRDLKENVFQDFISVVKYMKNLGYDVIVMGSSNGGLLTAVTMIRIPELLNGVLIGYPLTDMLRFHKLYIGRLWIDEYGDPDNPVDREYLLKYSPYHNLKPGVKYPLALIYTGLHDDRVHPGHALKFSAKLDEIGVVNYLRVETESGHSGANPGVKLNELLDILSFIYKVFGLKP